MSETSTRLLARLAASADTAAWASLVERHVDSMHRSAAAAAGSNLAHDAVQEAFLHVRRRAGLFRPPAIDDGEQAAGAWLRTIAANCALNLARSARRRSHQEQQGSAMAILVSDSAAPLIANEEQVLLRRALADMPERERRPIVLRYFAGVVGKEHLGAALGCSADAAGMRLHRALKHLRDRLARLGVVTSLALLLQHLEAAEASAAVLDSADPAFLRTCQDLLIGHTTPVLSYHAVIPCLENPLMRFALVASLLLIIAGAIGLHLVGEDSAPIVGSVKSATVPVAVIPPASAAVKPTWASRTGTDQYGLWADLQVGDVTQRLRWIQPGTFTMGVLLPGEKLDANGNQRPAIGGPGCGGILHPVTLTTGFWMADCPCTLALWQAVTKSIPSGFTERPLQSPVKVSWDDAQRFLSSLNTLVAHNSFRLPTEAQWEYACRAGNCRATDLHALPLCATTSSELLREVKMKPANAYGLFDLGNCIFSEACADWDGGISRDPVTDPTGPPSGRIHVSRGVAWRSIIDGSSCWSGMLRWPNQSQPDGFRFIAQTKP